MKGIRSTVATVIVIGLLTSSAVGVAAQDESTRTGAPIQMTLVRVGDCTDVSATPGDGEVTMTSVTSCRPRWTTSDPRLDGAAEVWFTDYEYANGLMAGSISRIVENEHGIWPQRPGFSFELPGGFEGGGTDVVMDGEGDYDGLVFVGVADAGDSGVDFHGFIVEGPFPPPAELAATEKRHQTLISSSPRARDALLATIP